MKILVDTSIIVEIDRHNKEAVAFLQKLVEKNHELIISTVTVAEILTGAHLCRETKTAFLKVKEILNQFDWIEVDGTVAERAAELSAFLWLQNKHESVEYQDVLIAATARATYADALITLNKKDFIVFPDMKNKVYTPQEYGKFL